MRKTITYYKEYSCINEPYKNVQQCSSTIVGVNNENKELRSLNDPSFWISRLTVKVRL